jgi:hypothetical protein
MLTEQSIIDFFEPLDFDIRISGNGRWIDQKCTPDVLSFIADCIYCYATSHDAGEEFCTKDIWFSEYATTNAEAVFKKPSPKQKAAKNEYDKFFQQPMKLLANAQILIERKDCNKNIYKVKNIEILEYIAISDKNSLKFLCRYIQKVLLDSGIDNHFKTFFDNQKSVAGNKDKMQTLYINLKKEFYYFTHRYTAIEKDLECGRIFTKVINPLAYLYNAYGTEAGRISKDKITLDALMYNRNNFRDIYANKPKGITRKVYAAENPIEINEKYYEYQSSKAKRFLRIFNDQYRNNQSEYVENSSVNESATHIHHIFSKAMYPEICYYLENLIALTPTQHLNHAHPNSRTQEVDSEYQKLLLLAKADRIKENLEECYSEKIERIYEFSKFLHVLGVGFDDDDVESINDMDFISVMNAINVYYA